MLQNKDWWEQYSPSASKFFVWVEVAPNYKVSQEVSKEEAESLVASGWKQKCEKLNLFLANGEMFIG